MEDLISLVSVAADTQRNRSCLNVKDTYIGMYVHTYNTIHTYVHMYVH